MSIAKTAFKKSGALFLLLLLLLLLLLSKFLSSDVAFYLYKATLYLNKADLHRILSLCVSWLF